MLFRCTSFLAVAESVFTDVTKPTDPSAGGDNSGLEVHSTTSETRPPDNSNSGALMCDSNSLAPRLSVH